MSLPPVPLSSDDPLPLPPAQNDLPSAERGPTNQSNSTMSSGEGIASSQGNAGEALADGDAVPDKRGIQTGIPEASGPEMADAVPSQAFDTPIKHKKPDAPDSLSLLTRETIMIARIPNPVHHPRRRRRRKMEDQSGTVGGCLWEQIIHAGCCMSLPCAWCSPCACRTAHGCKTCISHSRCDLQGQQ